MIDKPCSDIQECPDCASTNIRCSEARDQVICRDCGLIFEPLEPSTEAAFEKTHDLTMKAAKSGKAASKKKK